jgi:glutamyl-tRNA reductase
MTTDNEQKDGNYLQKIEQKTETSKRDVKDISLVAGKLAEKFFDMHGKIIDMRIEEIKADVEREKIQSEIKKIDERHKTIRDYLGKKLAQSRARMNKEFEVIDRALEEHNDNLVIKGLNSLDKLSEENPVDELADIEKLL